MQYIISLICTALVYGLADPDQKVFVDPNEAAHTEKFCSVKASVFSVNTSWANRIGGPVILTTKSSIDVCKKKSGAKVFRKVYIREEYKSSPLNMQILRGVAVESVNNLYKHERFNVYDGIEFIVYNQSKTVVERLVKERSGGQMFSLKMSLDNWNEVGTVVNKYAAKINHVELDVAANEKGYDAFRKTLELYPKITFSASNKANQTEMMSLAKDYSKAVSRKVGYVVFTRTAHFRVSLTAGI
ncbi:hypothetical protein DSO57_1007847 [Entomophthora muscae]|uniref:Uncharacterized protein n=2 Tax=Entomophthora muscae TaxID=34485 RepID=A0ACC2RYG9_9FUNG|nr:hypothetical protein DSO57_1007846 [Entomophthora muscae]KAJ9055092.1 hypothetical protein DSO57_1007847 [Entomophthora muscae]